MNIAIASGKGGTGKTTIATNLAQVIADLGKPVCYLDCDVEEPNGHLFLNPIINHTQLASIPVPVIDESLCNACGECVRFCRYNALIRLGKTIIVFPEMCHGCGGCTLLCPNSAIHEENNEIGTVETGRSGEITFVHGKLTIGKAMSPPLIRSVLRCATSTGINIIDAPPGTSCPVIASIRTADFTVLVTEPTPFGLNDLGLALDMIQELKVPHAAVINRADESIATAREFCSQRQVKIIAEIPEDRRIAEAYSRGELICKVIPETRAIFETLWQHILQQVQP
jgi:MinD superfamily P-loop ATPase